MDKNQIFDETNKLIKSRLASPFYGTFIFSWVALNWKLIYVTLFLDGDLLFKKYFLLKTDYLNILYNENSVFGDYGYFIWFLIFPFLSAYFIVFYFSKVITKFYNKDGNVLKERKISDIKREKEVEDKKKGLYKIINERKDEEIKSLNKDKDKEKIEEEKWWSEFQKWKKNKDIMRYIENVYTSIYQYDGKKESGSYNDFWKIDKDSLSWIDLNKLIKMQGNRIALTEKGRYILKLYLEDKK